MNINIKLEKGDVINLILGTSPPFNLQDDDLISKCGYMSRPAFSNCDERWYWDDDKLEKLSIENLLLMFNILKYREPKIVSDITDPNILKPYPYIKLGEGGTEMRLRANNSYYRDAGHWEIGYNWINNKLISHFSDNEDRLNGIEMFEITREEYAKANNQYLPNNY